MRILFAGSAHSLNMKAVYLEVLADMVGSIGVIIAALIIRYTGWWQVDAVIAVLIGLWVLPRTWKLLSESVNILLEGVPLEVDMQKLQDALAAIPGVTEVHDLHIWAITSGQNNLTAHLKVAESVSQSVLRQQAQEVVKAHAIHHSNFQIEVEAHEALQH